MNSHVNLNDIVLKKGNAIFNSTSYNGSFYVGTNDQGILLKTFFLFRFRHPTLFIPWHAIDQIVYEKMKTPSNTLLMRLKKYLIAEFYIIRLNEFPNYKLKLLK